MDVQQFYHSRLQDWKNLEALIARFERSPRSISPTEIQDLTFLYRAATSDLALAQREFPDHRISKGLNQLVARAHAVIYRSPPSSTKRVKDFFIRQIPQTFRRLRPFVLVAACFLFIPAFIAGAMTARDPSSAYWAMPEPMQQEVKDAFENEELWTYAPIEDRPYAASFIMQNNILVSIYAFGLGLILCLPTLWVMMTNGFMLGGVLGLAFHFGYGSELTNFVIGHGIVELSVITFAGGAGLRIGWAILQPGMVSRTTALRQASGEALRVVVACVLFLIGAGIIEGLISTAEEIPALFKWMVGLGSGALMYAYLLLCGKTKDQLEARSPLQFKVSVDH